MPDTAALAELKLLKITKPKFRGTPVFLSTATDAEDQENSHQNNLMNH